jgi:hypothetical protein
MGCEELDVKSKKRKQKEIEEILFSVFGFIVCFPTWSGNYAGKLYNAFPMRTSICH